MPSILLEAGVFRVTVRYVIAVRKGSSLYYHRRIPDALQSHYEGKKFRRVSLGTRDIAVAAPKAAKLAAEDDALWASLRSEEGQRARLTTPQVREAANALLASLGLSPGDLTKQSTWMNGPDAAEVMDDYLAKRHGTPYEEIRHDDRMPREAHEAFWSPVEHEAVRMLREDPTKPRRLLSDALAVYLKEHDKGVLPKFAGDTRRAIGHVFSIVGDFPLETYRRDHAVAVRDGLLKGGNKTATARRRLNTIKDVFNKGLIEFNMGAHRNPFEKLTIAKEAQDAKEREPFTSDELKVIAEACRIKDDDVRYIVALQADTGARLGEIVGLRAEDVVLDHETPHIRIRPHVALGRTLRACHRLSQSRAAARQRTPVKLAAVFS